MPVTSLNSKRNSILREPDLDNTSGGKRQRQRKLDHFIGSDLQAAALMFRAAAFYALWMKEH